MFYKHADTRKEIDAELGKRGNGYAITPKGSDPLSDSVVRLYAMGYDHWSRVSHMMTFCPVVGLSLIVDRGLQALNTVAGVSVLVQKDSMHLFFFSFFFSPREGRVWRARGEGGREDGALDRYESSNVTSLWAFLNGVRPFQFQST